MIMAPKAAFTPGQHVAGNMLLVAGNKIVCPSVAGYKGMSCCRDTGNMLPAISNMLPGNMLLFRATCCPGVL